MHDSDGAARAAGITFDAWRKANGVVLHGITSGIVLDGERGVIAQHHIPAGSLILQVPERALITNRAARSDVTFAAALAGAGHQLTPLQSLAAFLLYEGAKGSSSRWAPYLELLPASYTTFFTWTAQDIAGLQVDYAVTEAAESCRALHDEWQATLPVLRSLGLKRRWTGISAWQWAASTLASRTMHLPHDAAGALTPFGDLHNYRPPPPPFIPELAGVSSLIVGSGGPSGDGVFDEESAEYRLYTRAALSPGDQVYVQYGCYTNLELLEHYGFQLDDNPHDKALLPHPVLARALGSEAAAALSPAQAALHACGVPSWPLLQAMRLAAASPQELKRSAHLAAAGRPVSPAAEASALQLFRRICSETLQGLPTSLEEDMDQLAAVPEGQERLRLAMTWRLSHKKILQRGIQVAKQALCHVQPE